MMPPSTEPNGRRCLVWFRSVWSVVNPFPWE